MQYCHQVKTKQNKKPKTNKAKKRGGRKTGSGTYLK